MQQHRFTLLTWADGEMDHLGVCCDCGWAKQITGEGWDYPWPTPMDAANAYAEHVKES